MMKRRKKCEQRMIGKSPLLLFHRKLRWFLRRGPALNLMEEWEGTWSEGLCWILAEGLLQWITFSSLFEPIDASLLILGHERCPAGHVVVCVRAGGHTGSEKRWYLDSDGVSSEEVLLQTWREDEQAKEAFLAAYDEQLLRDHHIQRDPDKSVRVAGCLLDAFGLFSLSFLESSEGAGRREDSE